MAFRWLIRHNDMDGERMRSRREIEERMHLLHAEGNHDASGLLGWVLQDPECALCAHLSCREFEMKLHREEVTSSFLEMKMNWPVGTVDTHMKEHLEYDPTEASVVEQARTETIDTLNVAENLMQRMVGWLDELEDRREIEGVTSEWIADATRLTGQCHTGLKLIGQLKKEIGVDSQLLLADRKMDAVMGILVDTLREEPRLLDTIELKLASLKAPSNIIEVDFEVMDE